MGVEIAPDESDACKWMCTFDGPEGTPFIGGKFKVEVDFSDNYPFKCPKVLFKTKIYHPGVSQDKGEICTQAIEQQWVPTLNARFVIEAVKTLLVDPSEAANNPLEADVANKYKTDKNGFNATAAEWVQKFAS